MLRIVISGHVSNGIRVAKDEGTFLTLKGC